MGLNFALRSGQEHRSLTREQLIIGSSSSGKYIEYAEKVSKTNKRGLKHVKVKPKVSRAFERSGCPARCIVRLYELYLSHCPEFKGPDSPVYLKPLKKISSQVWYACVPLGQHTLGSVVRDMCKGAGLEGISCMHFYIYFC
jgi:hypothetical protein